MPWPQQPPVRVRAAAAEEAVVVSAAAVADAAAPVVVGAVADAAVVGCAWVEREAAVVEGPLPPPTTAVSISRFDSTSSGSEVGQPSWPVLLPVAPSCPIVLQSLLGQRGLAPHRLHEHFRQS